MRRTNDTCLFGRSIRERSFVLDNAASLLREEGLMESTLDRRNWLKIRKTGQRK